MQEAAVRRETDRYYGVAFTDAVSLADRLDFLKTATAQQSSSDRTALFRVAAQSLTKLCDKAAEFSIPLEGQIAAVCTKEKESADFKIDEDYNGDASLACDLVRCTAIIDPDKIPMLRVLLALNSSVRSIKDTIAEPSKTGLRILNAKVELDNGHIGEIQFVTPHMRQAMQMTHKAYKEIDGLTLTFKSAAFSEEVSNRINTLKAKCQDAHATGAALDGLDRFLDKKSGDRHPALALAA